METGKTTTQSFGQTEKIITATGTYNCYPSEGGMIVVDDVAGAGAITLNLVLTQDPVGAYEPNANPPNAAGGGTPLLSPSASSLSRKSAQHGWLAGCVTSLVGSLSVPLTSTKS